MNHLQQYGASDAPGDKTELEVIRDSMRERIKCVQETNERLSGLVIKLCGSLAPSDKAGNGPTPVPNGLIADLQDATAVLSAMQTTTLDLIGRLSSVI